MATHPIVPARTAMLFFDTLKGYLRPEDPSARGAIDASGVYQGPAVRASSPRAEARNWLDARRFANPY